MPPRVKLGNDKGISFVMIYSEYIKIFNRLFNVGRIVYPIRVPPKSFDNSCMFKKCGAHSTINFLKLKGCTKFLRLVSLGLNHKDLRANPWKESLKRGKNPNDSQVY